MIEINNLTQTEINEEFVKNIIENILEKEKKNTDSDVSIAFLSPVKMRKLNKQFREENKTTNGRLKNEIFHINYFDNFITRRLL